jgi:hypothetical protein
MPSLINGPGMLSIQVIILFLTVIQTVGVIIILLKLNLGLRDFFSLSPLVDRTEGNVFLTAKERTPLPQNKVRYDGD